MLSADNTRPASAEARVSGDQDTLEDPVVNSVRVVMTFAADPEASARWWGELLNVVKLDGSDTGAGYAWVEHDGVELGFHPADDERNPRGGSPVVYWGVDDVDRVRERLLAAGCEHHRGP